MNKCVEIETSKLISIDESNKLGSSLRKLFNKRQVLKILLINPPDGDAEMFNYDVAKTKRYTNFAPYGLGIISKHLNFKHYETNILNLNDIILKKVHSSSHKEEFDYKKILNDELKFVIDSFKPDLIGLTCMFSMTHKSLKYVSETIKKYTDCPIAAGGVHISNSIWSEDTRENFLKDLCEIDLFFLFEAELAFSEFLDLANQNFDNLGLLKQIIIRDENQTYLIKERLRPEGESLNIIPDHNEMRSFALSNTGKVGNFGWLKDENENKEKFLTTQNYVQSIGVMAMLNKLDADKYASLETGTIEDDDEAISLNTKETKYADYFARVKFQIEQVWTYPMEAARHGVSGQSTLKFKLSREGNLVGVRLVESSGTSTLDEAALKAVKKASPYYPFPPNFQKDSITILATFIYSPTYSNSMY